MKRGRSEEGVVQGRARRGCRIQEHHKAVLRCKYRVDEQKMIKQRRDDSRPITMMEAPNRSKKDL